MNNTPESGSGLKSNFLDRFEVTTKVVSGISVFFAVLGFIFYGVGFIIVSTYFARYGIRDFELFRPSYLVAGIIFVALHLIVFSLCIGVPIYLKKVLELRQSTTSSFNRSFLSICSTLGGIIVGVIVLSGFMYLLAGESVQYADARMDAYNYLKKLFVFSWVLSLGINLFYDYRRALRETVLEKLKPLALYGFLLISILILSIIPIFSLYLTQQWGELVYPHLSNSFAGIENPDLVFVVISSDAEQQFSKQASFIRTADGITEPLILIDENDQWITVGNEAGRIARISKSSVSAIYYATPFSYSESR